MSEYQYTAYGFNFSSTFPLPELRPHSAESPDIKIRLGETPPKLPFASEHGLAWQSMPGKLLLTVENVARYLVNGTDEVIVEPLAKNVENEVRIFLLGSVLGAILHTKEMLVLHSSVINTPKGAVLMMGKSRAGKSTLLGTFLKRGYSMIADDKAGIVVNKNGIAEAMPAFPMTRLTKETVKKIHFPVDEIYYKPSIEKYFLPIENFCSEPQKIHACYSLNPNNGSEISLTRFDVLESFQTLNRHTYRRRYLTQKEQKTSHFGIVSALSNQAKVVKVIRPDDSTRIDELANLIEEDFSR